MMPRKLSLTFIAFLSQAPLSADGGTVQLRKLAGALVITVFTSPAPVSAGPTDISILLQERNGFEPVLDAIITMRLRTEASDTEVQVQPTRQQAQNKLLYAATVTFPESGKWRLTLTILRNGERTDATGTIDVAPAPEIAAPYWSYLMFPPILVAAYVVRERLIRRKRRR